jgi:hypothetical protein
MDYAEAKARANALWDAHKALADKLALFPRGAMGLVPDAVKDSPEWKAAYAAERKAFFALREYNGWYVKTFNAERKAERKLKGR